MSKTLKAKVCALLGVLLLSVSFLPGSAGAHAGSTVADMSATGKEKESKTTIYKGDALKKHIEKMRLKNKALERAMKDMEKLGKVPNWEASGRVVEEPEASAHLQLGAAIKPVSFGQTQDYANDGNGNEMTIITYYGDDSFWDGTVYTYNASTGITDVYNGVIYDLVSGDAETAEVVDELYYPPDGGAPYRETQCGGEYPCLQIMDVAKVDVDGNYAKMAGTSPQLRKVSAARPGFIGWLTRFYRCIRRCNRISAACAVLPPRYRNTCRILAVVGSAVVCAFNTNACQ